MAGSIQPCERAAALVVQLSLLFVLRSHAKRSSMIHAQHLALTRGAHGHHQQGFTKRLLQVRLDAWDSGAATDAKMC